ncbi:MAG: hypothetical protein ACXWQ5_00525 [Ktedonobacterales bacterium]
MVKVDTRKLLLRTFREYVIKHSFTFNGAHKAYLVNADNFYTHAFEVFAVEAHQHLSPLYVESVLHNAGVQMRVIRSGNGMEEYCYAVPEHLYQTLLTFW